MLQDFMMHKMMMVVMVVIVGCGWQPCQTRHLIGGGDGIVGQPTYPFFSLHLGSDVREFFGHRISEKKSSFNVRQNKPGPKMSSWLNG